MKKHAAIALSAVTLALCAHIAMTQSGGGEEKNAVGFERLKTLAGTWQGEGPHGMTTVTYQVVAGGTAIIETLLPPDEPSMITVYYCDGDKLMLTHYCSIGNQPRMRAQQPSRESNTLHFAFLDATDLQKPSDGHMIGLTLTFQAANRLKQSWLWQQDGKAETSTFDLTRLKN